QGADRSDHRGRGGDGLRAGSRRVDPQPRCRHGPPVPEALSHTPEETTMARRRAADDDLFRVHSRYLGPPGFTFPFSIPHRGIVPGVAAGLVTLVVMSLLGVGIWRFAIAAAAAIAAGALADRYSTSERPVSSLPTIVRHETGAPRPHDP